MSCPACGHPNPTDQKFCGQCGARLAIRCAACGASSPPGQKFCGECGAALAAGATAPPYAAPDSYTPKHLADRILTSKSALEGERKQVTVLFADLKGSMELLADRDPEEARRILDPVLARMMESVHRFEGTVNQVMGDGIMALFGAPLAHEDHAVRACYAALRMQDAIRRYTDEVRRSQGVEVQIRVGLNSGDVVVRSIGSDLRMDYTAVGQTTHLAARMEQLAPPGTTRLTAETLRLAEGFVHVKPLGPIPVKGLAEPVEVFELTGAAAARTRIQASRARGFSRFVGRDAEMEQIRQAAGQARGGRGQVVAVVGEPGVGKSRLFYEFIHSHHTHDWLVLESSSVSYGKATPFLPLADLLRAYFRIEDRDDTRGVRAKVTGTMLTLDRALDDALPAILWLLDALPSDDAFLALDPSQRRQRAVDAAKRLLLRESRVQPLLLVFEDLHWIDAETQAVLDSLIEGLPTASVLLAVNYRPEYRHAWGNKTYYRQLRIDPLPPESAAAFLGALLGDDASVAPLKPLLIGRTEGNPLFLEESVRTLAETRALVGEPGAYRLVKALDAVLVPPSVQAILASRIDRLNPELKRLLQAASVVGKDVPVGLLEAIADVKDDDLRRALGELQTAEFIYETRLFPDLEYTFKHALTHEVAYGSVLHDRRRSLHAAIVDAIERLHADRLSEQVEVLAHHAARGGDAAKAARYLRQAGARAAARSSNREAIEFFQAALAKLAELPESEQTLSDALDVRIGLGPALMVVRGSSSVEAEASYREALTLADRIDDASRRFPALWGLWFITMYQRGQHAATLEGSKRLLEAATASGDRGHLVEAHHAMWATATAMGAGALGIAHADAGLALYDRAQHATQALSYAGHDAGACGLYQRAANRWLLGYPDRAMDDMREAFRLAEDLRHPTTLIATMWFGAWMHYQRGESEAAIDLAERILGLSTAHGIQGWKDCAVFLTRLAGPPSAELLTQMLERVVSERSATWRRVFAHCAIAELAVTAGHPDVGVRALRSVPETERTTFCAPELHRVEGDLLLRGAARASDDAERCFRTAVELARRRDEKSLELRAATSLGRLLAEQGKRDEARDLVANVYGWFTEGFDTRDLQAAKTLLEQL